MDYNKIVVSENIPQDINAEVFLGFFPQDTFCVKFCGLHKRNVYNDILEIEKKQDKFLLHLGRNSLYNSLPEYLFHSIDRFDNIPEREKKQKFSEEYAKQEREKEQAYKFFSPIDILLFQLRLEVRERMNKYVESNIVIQDILLDKLTTEQRENRFIKRTIPYISSCKTIRGNRTLITLLLRKVLADEGIKINVKSKRTEFTDEKPRYGNSEGCEIGDVYIGNTYSESVLTYSISYWSDEDCNDEFLLFVNDLVIFRQFVQDYFISVDSVLVFDVSKDLSPLKISDTTQYNYLNYNTNI
ncbi:hypothetical protein [Leyella lascolaii]|uniref:Uncharacterized protein n=1 Tax=Leyella lascolaii TaxID=1776379 RepID=A0AAW7JJ27_9BACT|nr:hypothetical protein [Leyella lascolaii]MDN0022669.1 hypothetical protein [Leyella lascolaii]MDN0025863.1 hypothetical protein [Leyella lascolaii]